MVQRLDDLHDAQEAKEAHRAGPVAEPLPDLDEVAHRLSDMA